MAVAQDKKDGVTSTLEMSCRKGRHVKVVLNIDTLHKIKHLNGSRGYKEMEKKKGLKQKMGPKKRRYTTHKRI